VAVQAAFNRLTYQPGPFVPLMLDTVSSHVSESWSEACDGLVVTAGPEAGAIGSFNLLVSPFLEATADRPRSPRGPG
jgi:hypothetical protein